MEFHKAACTFLFVLVSVSLSFGQDVQPLPRTSEQVPKFTGLAFGPPLLQPTPKPTQASGPQMFAATGTTVANMTYHGGPVLKAAIPMYGIFYGNWNGSTGPAIIQYFLNHLGGSPWFAINSAYTDKSNQGPINSLSYKKSTFPGYPYGTSITDANLGQLITDAINAGIFPAATNGVYFIFTSPDVKQSYSSYDKFCKTYCGYHSSFTTSTNLKLKYAFVGNPYFNKTAGAVNQCGNGVCGSTTNKPNGDAAIDAMISIIAHELSEAATDSLGNGWYDDSNGYENGDKCNFDFGPTLKTNTTGQTYNIMLGARYFLIQQMWKLDGNGYCAMS